MLIVLLFAAASSVALASPKGGQCYDCNYAPDGIVKNSNGTWAATKNDVFHHCALATSDNANYINKRNCISGRCFVRKDENGMVFRGCADQWNLPWGIDTSKSCEQQSYQGSVWWFCDGDLCNDVNIESECGSVPVRSGDEAPAVVTNVQDGTGFDPDHEVTMGDTDGGVLYAYPAEPLQPGYETVHGQEYAYWKDTPKRKRRPINRRSDGYQTKQTGPQDDVYYSRISGHPVLAEAAPAIYLPVPQPENPHVFVEPVAIEEKPVVVEPQPEVIAPAYEAAPSWWNYFPFNYNYKQQNAVNPLNGYYNNVDPWKSTYAAEKPKQEEPKPVVNTYKPNPKRTEVNIAPAQSSSGSWSQKEYPSQTWSQGTSYRAAPEPSYKVAPEPSYVAAPEPSYVAAPEPSYRSAPEPSYRSAPEPSYRSAPEPSYRVAPEPSYTAPKVTYTKPQAIYKIEYEAPSYVPAPEPEQPVEYHTYQTNDDPNRRDYYADKRQTDTGYDRPYVYFAERNDPYETPDERGQTRLGKPAYDPENPCDGHCLDNPTGLFVDTANPTGFIQCGSGFRNSGACDCCAPFYHQCAEGTVFDDVTKICGLGREVNRGKKRYSSVEY